MRALTKKHVGFIEKNEREHRNRWENFLEHTSTRRGFSQSWSRRPQDGAVLRKEIYDEILESNKAAATIPSKKDLQLILSKK